MPIKYQKWIERSDLQNNPEDVYIFGDNYARQGLCGQAKAMRGEPNALGIATKRTPDHNAARLRFVGKAEPRYRL